MKSLKDLSVHEIKSSMIFLCIGISAVIGIFFGTIQFHQLQSNIKLIDYYIQETVNNSLTVEQPILIQRSISELWKAFSEKKSAIVSLDVYLNNSLISEVGKSQDNYSIFNYSVQKCTSYSQQNICVNYIISPILFFSEIFLALIIIVLSTLVVYAARRALAVKNIEALTIPLEEEISRISTLATEFKNFKTEILNLNIETTKSSSSSIPIREISLLSESYKDLLIHSQKYITLKKAEELNSSLGLQAKQVSHDIRSPLSALTMITSTLTQVPEDKRLIIRNAVNRINDIANTLLEQAKQSKSQAEQGNNLKNNQQSTDGANTNNSAATQTLSTEFVPAIVDTLVSEKRVQFREKIGVEIEEDLRGSYGSFARVNSTELKRVLSNLINNSVEAFPNQKGKVMVSVRAYSDKLLISVQDNGKGIPKSILEKLGQEGVTHGKEGSLSGSGLGVFHAKKTIENFGGQFQIQSSENEGSLISISLPRANSPDWFVKQLRLVQGQTIAVLDDDSSIHQIWQGRVKSLITQGENTLTKIEQLSIFSFTSAKEFRKWYQASPAKADLYLVDYELVAQNETGLDVVESLGLGRKAILVTSRYEEPHIKARCEKLGIQLIPKTMAPFVPMVIEPRKIEKAKEKYHCILIDDDPLIEMTWTMAAKEHNKSLRYFTCPQDFFKACSEIDPTTPVYIDSNLGVDEQGQSIKGEAVAKDIFEKGFKEIYLATGYAQEDIKTEAYIKAVVGKDPVF